MGRLLYGSHATCYQRRPRARHLNVPPIMAAHEAAPISRAPGSPV